MKKLVVLALGAAICNFAFAEDLVVETTYTLQNDLTLSSLTLTNANATLDLAGHNLTVSNAWVSPSALITNSSNTRAVFAVENPTNETAAAYTCRMSGDFIFRTASTNTVVSLASDDINNTKIEVAEGQLNLAPGSKITCQMIRLNVTTNAAGSSGWSTQDPNTWQLSEFYLMNDGVDIPLSNGRAVAWQETIYSVGSPPSELIDGILSNDSKLFTALERPLYIYFNETLTFDSYAFALAGDQPGRDPTDWTLEAGIVKNNVTNWYKISDVVDWKVGDSWNWTLQWNQRNLRQGALKAEWLNGSPHGVTLPETYELNVAEGAKASIRHLGSDMATETRKWTGSGEIELTGRILASVERKGDFEGTLTVLGGMTDVPFSSEKTALTVNVGTIHLSASSSDSSGDTTVVNGAFLSADATLARYIRFTAHEVLWRRGVADPSVQLGEFALYYNGERILWPVGMVATGNDAEDLVDGIVDAQNKWLSKLEKPVTIELPYPIRFNGYSLWTGNDCVWDYGASSRQPISWTVEFSDNGDDWFVFDHVTDNYTVYNLDKSPVVSVTFPQNAEGFNPNSVWSTLLQLTNARFYTCTKDSYAKNTLSPNSPVILNGTATITTQEETIPSLAGAGQLTLGEATVFTVSDGRRAAFGGTISNGVFVKAGDGVQVLGGTLACRQIVVEGGELNLDGATLAGVREIILKGGVLTGAATCTGGDLTVTAAGGAYNASITGIGQLTLTRAAVEGEADELHAFTIHSGWKEEPISKTLFGFSALADGALEVFNDIAVDDAPKSCTFSKKQNIDAHGTGTLGYSLAKSGLHVILR